VSGYLLQGGWWQGFPVTLGLLLGRVDLEEAGAKPGDKVRGTIRAEIHQWPF
jgi:hypothetical protein